jgi:hypothetical protein
VTNVAEVAIKVKSAFRRRARRKHFLMEGADVALSLASVDP